MAENAENKGTPATDVAVFGSINIDIVARVEALPRPGETVLGGDLDVLLGGKGANQAVAAARAGARTAMIGAVGDQSFGLDPRAAMAGWGVDITGVADLPGPTGAALISVDAKGENAIAVSSGANGRIGEAPAPAISARVLLAQLELPPELVRDRFRAARDAGAITILNAAPALAVPHDLFALTDLLIVNESELATYAETRIDGASDDAAIAGAAARLRRDRRQRVIVTLGARGVLALDGAETLRIPARVAETVDATGAGDCFCGWIAAGLAEERGLEHALARAVAAAAISVSRRGAAPSMPDRLEVEAAL